MVGRVFGMVGVLVFIGLVLIFSRRGGSRFKVGVARNSGAGFLGCLGVCYLADDLGCLFFDFWGRCGCSLFGEILFEVCGYFGVGRGGV